MTAVGGSWREGVDLAMPELLAQRIVQRLPRRVQRPVRSRGGQNNRARPLGRGLDFAELRPYQAGDELRFIDWKTTARRGQVHSKLFQEERERPVLLVVDLRQALRYGTRVCFKSVQCARLAAALAWRAAGQGDKVGALVFNDSEHRELPPKNGEKGVARLCRAMVDVHQSSRAGSLSMAELLTELSRVLHAGGEAFVISDFHDWDQSAQLALGGACRHAALSMIHVVDPLQWQLPEKAGCAVSDGVMRRLLPRANTAAAQQYSEQFYRRAEQLSHEFHQAGARYQRLSTENSVSDALMMGRV